MSSNKMIDINISIDDENYLKNLIIKFRNNIIKSYDFENFEKISTNWIKTSLESSDKDPEIFLKIMENHKENKSWFTSLIGYFYQFGIGCNLNREKALDCYLIAINNNINYDTLDIINKNQLPMIVKNNGVFNLLRNSNTIIGKYLLSLFYYKDFINSILSVTDLEQNKLLFLLKLDGKSKLEVHFNLIICRKDVNVDYKKVFELLLSLTEKKNLDAQYNLAICYMDGIGTQKDEKKAFDLFLESSIKPNISSAFKNRLRSKFEMDLESAISNDSIAQSKVGCHFQSGKVVKRNKIRSFKWYLKSAKNGYVKSQINVGSCYECGKGTDKNEIEAFKWYLKSAENGDVKSQSYIGYCYLKGYGIDKNESKAFKWYLKSAKNGNAMSQNNVGYCYDHGIGTDKDETKAFEWYTKSAIIGCNDGQYNLGYCYENGKGTDKNEIKAFEWYTKAAEYNNIVAQNNLGDCYKYGKGTDKDEKKAFEWYLKSAKNGYKMGQNNVGYCYEHGCGTGKNQSNATQWFKKAAKSVVAQNNLRTCKYGVEIAIKDLL
ncbi:HCP-like protein [Rhizophagus irregularis]|uniref:HCP-like protein n=1 Tax=Rhizophagus irregularis TaxID=588596 RepID=A0A2I1E014_9GLOM|nr:HCP-like protein [Rhizophagus irregularis]PKY15470.1 HCP-like protein [Rhizophagus irregularis]